MARRRTSAIGSFFEGFNQTYDTLDKINERSQLNDIANSKPEEFQQYSPDQAAQLEAAANAKDADGNPLYTVQANEGGTYSVTPTAPDSESGTMTPGLTRSMFRGQTYDKPPTDAEQLAVKSNAMADVVSRRDPVTAMRLRVAGLEAKKAGQEDADQQTIRAAWNAPDDSQPVPGLRRIDTTPATGSNAHGTMATPKEADDALSSMGAGGSDVATGSVPLAQPKPVASTIDPGQAAAAEARLRNASGSINQNQATAAESIVRSATSDQTSTAPPVDRQSYAAAEQTLQRSAARPALDAYVNRKVPAIINTYLQQGKVDEAKKLRDFVDSSEGRDYAHQWSQGVRKLSIGDYHGALNDWQDLYNRQLYNDGNTVKLTPLNDGSQYRVDLFGPDGTQTGTKTMPTSALAKQAGMALSPEKLVEFQATQQAKREGESALLDRQIQLENLRQSGQENREDRRDDRLGMRLDAQSEALDRRLSSTGRLSVPQQRTNDSIQAARQRLSNMSQPDVLALTQASTATGRPNPNYDPEIARIAKLANTRMYGDDRAHDEYTASRQRPTAQPAQTPLAEASAAFTANPAMKGMRLGRQTANGIEVFDQAGNHVGHFGKR